MSLAAIKTITGSRGADVVAGADNLFLQPDGLSADAVTAQIASALPASLLAPDSDEPAAAQPHAAAAPAQAASDLQATVGSVLGLTAAGSATGLLSGLSAGGEPGAPLISLGQSIADLGHDSGHTLAADVLRLPGEVSGLNQTSGNVADALTNTGNSVVYTGDFVNDITDTLGEASNQPLAATANQAVADFHRFIEFVTHETGGTYVAHGVTALGEAVGFGHIGQDNILTDALNFPGTVLSGGDALGAVAHITDHLPQVTNGIGGILNALPNDLGSGPLGLGILGPEGIVGGSGLDLGSLGDVLGPSGGGPLGAVGGLVDNATNVLDLVGSNSDGGGNLITDALLIPGELLSGTGTPSLTDAGHQLDVTVVATGDLVQDILGAGTGGVGTSPNGVLGTVGTSLETFADTGGAAIGIPQTVEGLAATVQAVGLGDSAGSAPEGVLAGVQQTVEGALNDLGNDVALAGLGGADAIVIPSLGGGGLDALVGTLTPEGAGAGGVLAPVTAVLQVDGGDGGLLAGITSLANLDHHGQAGGNGHALGLL